MKRREFLKFPAVAAGGVLLAEGARAYADIGKPGGDESAVVLSNQASGISKIKTVATFSAPVVGLASHNGQLFVATTDALYLLDQEA